jgi:hypothetical protein
MIGEYLRKWFAGDQKKIAALHAVLSAKPRIRALAENPFLLSMICYTFAQGEDANLIERRSELYKNCTDALLRRGYDVESAKINTADTLKILKDLSLRFFLWQEADFPVDQVNVMGRRVLTAAALGAAETFLERVQRETGLLQRDKNQRVRSCSFRSQSFDLRVAPEGATTNLAPVQSLNRFLLFY